ncbi:MAG: DUF3368 domain-containing protein [Armatimonadetes bacterium]|nr:DUF3368 domain-containing protein [Armatimonadota bacterium]
MKEPIVADSTCLIGLERIGRLDVLPALFEPILVPPEVHREFGISVPWITLEAPADRGLVTSLKMLVDDGEAEAIALAHERGWRIVLDDRRARAVARRLEISIIGTVGILVRAKRTDVITSLDALLTELEACGFYISDDLKTQALRLADE